MLRGMNSADGVSGAFAEGRSGSPRGLLGPASARWNDYIGTAAADDAEAILNRPSLYELAEIDRDRWMILAVDILRRGSATTVRIYAIDRDAHQIVKASDLDDLGDAEGQLPVSTFDLPGPVAERFLNDAFGQISIRLVASYAQPHALVQRETSSR